MIVVTRYPGLPEPVVRGEYEEAVSIAAEAVRWAEEIIKVQRTSADSQKL